MHNITPTKREFLITEFPLLKSILFSQDTELVCVLSFGEIVRHSLFPAQHFRYQSRFLSSAFEVCGYRFFLSY
jgi:hypothetical protein